jgi:predicted nuclease with TOPRIM domain
MPWKPRAPTDLQRQLDAAQLKLLKANAELEHKIQCVSRLEILVAERNACIDALHGRIEQLQERNRRLDAEADRLAEMVRFASAVDTTMLAPK